MLLSRFTSFFLLIFLMLASISWGFQPALAIRTYELQDGKTVYGATRNMTTARIDNLLDIARDFDLGYNQIAAANPDIDPWIPADGAEILLPTTIVIPQERIDNGIVVNLAEMRLYYFFSNERHNYVFTAPIGVGDEGKLTQLGLYTVRTTDRHPTWYPPPSILAEEPGHPKVVPPGPDNPLGDYIFRLSKGLYGIHGTNKPYGIGRRVSHGCIRMYPEDIATLFPMVKPGTIVYVTYEPVKVGWADGVCYLQVFEDFEGKIENAFDEVFNRMQACVYAAGTGTLKIDKDAILDALDQRTGVPVPVGWPYQYTSTSEVASHSAGHRQ